jgi:hypothetical protein
MKKMKKRKPFVFWHSDDSIKKIKMINPGDINIDESLQKMGLSEKALSLGVCDVEEVVERNKVMQFLHINPKIRAEITRVFALYEKMSLPSSEDKFLYFYSKVENPYWDEVKKLVVKIKAVPNLPKALSAFVKCLEEDLPLESEERKMADAISPLLSGVAFMEGSFSIKASVSNEGKFSSESGIKDVFNLEVFGYKLFSMSYAAEYEAEIPAFFKKAFFRWTGIKALIQGIANERLKNKAKGASFIDVVSNGVKSDFSAGFDKIFENIVAPSLSPFKSVYFDFYFSYHKDGLRLRLISANVNQTNRYFSWMFDSKILSLKPELKKTLEKKEEKMTEIITASMARTKTEPIFHVFKDFFDKDIKISSPGTDADYKWYAIGHIYNSKNYKTLYDNLEDQRCFFFETLANLNSLIEILTIFEVKAEVYNLPLCVPTIATGHSGVFFKNLVPISLVGSGPTKIVPISLERINGQMVGLTGRHGGGKTTIGKNVLQNVYLALSGLPVFAESFNTDIKTVLGAVTNDEGAGSTATVFVKKVANLMKEIKEVPVHESLIFIDEIGKGTQQDAGMELGMAILSSLSKGGNSVLFNTQILELAEYAQNRLNAVCYKANKEFEFTKGISGGEISELIKEVGLDKYLN